MYLGGLECLAPGLDFLIGEADGAVALGPFLRAGNSCGACSAKNSLRLSFGG